MSLIVLTSSGMDARSAFLGRLPRTPPHLRVGYVTTAAKVERDRSYVAKARRVMEAEGWLVHEMDIEGKDANVVRKMMAAIDVVYVQGGNTFFLMRHVRGSGFADVMRECVGAGKAYIGVSAGSIIAGTDVGIAEIGDANDVGLTDLRGMGLVNVVVSPHYVLGEEDAIRSYEMRTGMTVVRLRDNQVLLVEDGDARVVGLENS